MNALGTVDPLSCPARSACRDTGSGKGSLSATFLPTEVVNRVRSDGLALRGPSIRPDSYRPVATLDERDHLSISDRLHIRRSGAGDVTATEAANAS